MKSFLFILIVTLLYIPNIYALKRTSLPNANFSIAVQQKSEEKLSKGYFLFELDCFGENCSLTEVALNQCFESDSGKQAFYPSAKIKSTRFQGIKVMNEGSSLVVREAGFFLGSYQSILQFEYERIGKDKDVLILTGFSGSLVKTSTILNKVITIEYIPLSETNQVVELDCGVLLPGISR